MHENDGRRRAASAIATVPRDPRERLAAFRKKHQGRIEVLGIGIEDDADAVRDFVKAYEMTLRPSRRVIL